MEVKRKSVSKLNKVADPVTLAQKIRQARSKDVLHLTQTEFAERLGTTQSNVAKWERGDYVPAPAQLVKIARLLAGRLEAFDFYKAAGVSDSYFENPESALPEVLERVPGIDGPETVLIPLLQDAIAAGNPRHIDERRITSRVPFAKQWLPRSGRLFAIKVSGDSMAPIVNDGYVVIIDVNQRDPRRLEGKMIAAREGDAVTIKWLRRDKGTYLLVPQHVSPRIPVRVMREEDDWGIVGEVLKWIGYPPPVRK
jgi:repressor LexA